MDNYSKLYANSVQLYKFPLTTGYTHEESYERQLDVKLTVGAFILNNAPASKKFYINFKDTVTANTNGYSVYQMDASQIVSGTNRIDVSKLASGVYFIKIGDKVSKFVKY